MLSRRAFLFGKSAEFRPEGEPLPKVASIDERCLTLRQVVCRTCGDVCEAGAIHFPLRLGGVARPVLADEKCTACGDCLNDCPAQAMQLVDLPARFEESLCQGAA